MIIGAPSYNLALSVSHLPVTVTAYAYAAVYIAFNVAVTNIRLMFWSNFCICRLAKFSEISNALDEL